MLPPPPKKKKLFGVSYGVNFDDFMTARCIYHQWRPPLRERMAWSNGIQLWNAILFLLGCILGPSLEMLDKGDYTVDETPSYQRSMDCMERMFFWRPSQCHDWHCCLLISVPAQVPLCGVFFLFLWMLFLVFGSTV